MRTLVFTLLLLGSFTANAAIYRCDSGGKLSYQDKPCVGSTSTDNQVEIDSRFLHPADATPATQACTRPSARRIQEAKDSATVISCMNKKEVLDAARPGKEYNSRTGTDDRGAYEVWFFSNTQAGFPPRVTFRGGFVESFGTDDSYGLPKSPAAVN